MDYAFDNEETANANGEIQQTSVDPFSPEYNPYGSSANPFSPENPLSTAGSTVAVQQPDSSVAGATNNGTVGPATASGGINPLVAGGAAVAGALAGGTGGNNISSGGVQMLTSGLQARQPGSGVNQTVAGVEQGLGAVKTGAGLVGKAAQLGAFGDDSSAIGSVAGDVGQVAGYAAIPLDVYNFVENYQSGATGADAINGAETGAAIGSVIPGVGTIIGGLVGGAIGAISSAFGGGETDPETTNWNSYIGATGGATPNASQQAMIAAATQGMSPQQSFNLLAGVMDIKDGRIPIVNVFGRMNEGSLLSSMATQINQAVASGKIAANASAQQMYSSVVEPWLNSKGATIGPETGGAQLQGVLTNLIGNWQNGNLNSNTRLDSGGNTDTTLPNYAGWSPQMVQQLAAQKQEATEAAQQSAAEQARGNRNADKLAKGGEVQMNKGKKYKFADGGQVDDSTNGSDGSDSSTPDTSTPDASTPDNSNQVSALQTVTAALLTKLGQDPTQAPKVVSVLQTLNPGVSDDDLLKNLGSQLPTVIAAATKAPNVQQTVNPTGQQTAQQGASAQNTAAAQATTSNMTHYLGDVAMANLSGSNNPNEAASTMENTPFINAKTSQGNVEAQGAARASDLAAQKADYEQQQAKFVAQQSGSQATILQNKAVQEALNTTYEQQKNDATSAVSVMMTNSTNASLPPNLRIKPGQLSAKQQADLLAQNGVSADIISKHAQAAALTAQAALATNQSRTAAVEAGYAERAARSSGLPGYTAQPALQAGAAPSAAAPSATPSAQTPSPSGTGTNDSTGEDETPLQPDIATRWQPGVKSAQDSNQATYDALVTNGTSQRANRINAAENAFSLLPQVNGFGPMATTAYRMGVGSGEARAARDQYTQQEKLFSNNGRSKGNSLGSQETAAAEFPSLANPGTLKDKQNQLAKVLGIDLKDQYLANLMTDQRNRNVRSVNDPTVTRQSLSAYVVIDNKTGKVVAKNVFGAGSADQTAQKQFLKQYKGNPNVTVIDAN